MTNGSLKKLRRKLQKYPETNDKYTTIQKSMRCNKNSSKREVYSNTILYQEVTKLSNK